MTRNRIFTDGLLSYIKRPGRSAWTRRAGRSARTGRASCSARASRTGRAGCSARASRAGWTSCTARASRTGWTSRYTLLYTTFLLRKFESILAFYIAFLLSKASNSRRLFSIYSSIRRCWSAKVNSIVISPFL